MINFSYTKPSSAIAAIKSCASHKSSKFIAGGTNLVDLMKKGVVAPEKIIDITDLPFKEIVHTPKGITIGALVNNSTVANNDVVKKNYPLLAMALNAGASAQLRNMATIAGNIMQKTRCPYFYDTTMPCNKRMPNTGCSAIEGYNRMHAIFGTSEKCIAVHPSDMCVALAALNAVVHVSTPKGDKEILFEDFHKLPQNTPEIDHVLQQGDLITEIFIPTNAYNKSTYLKIRDRLSYAFALVSVAVALDVKNNTIVQASLAMGGVAHKPWKLAQVEKFLVGKSINKENFTAAANLAMQNAVTYKHNAFKVKLGKAAIIQALTQACEL